MGSVGIKQVEISPISDLLNVSPKPSRKATDIWNAGLADARRMVQENRDAYSFSFGSNVTLPVLQNIQHNLVRQQEKLNTNTTLASEVRSERQRILNIMQRGLRGDWERYWKNRRGEL